LKNPRYSWQQAAGTLAIVIPFGTGCATHPIPTVQMAASQAAIAGALDAGAAELAPRELKSAQDKMELTKRWIAAKDYQPARWLAEQAQVDAELAAIKARAASRS
jgi:hypothetical protein